MGYLTRLSVLAAVAAATIATVSADSRELPAKAVKDTGAHAGDIRHAFEKFGRLLGEQDNESGPPAHRGRRSINWDGAGVPFKMPGDFFNTVVPHGAVFHAKGGEFRVSNPPREQHIDDDRFSSINKKLSKQIKTFSPKRLFTPLKGNVMEVRFEVPGKRGVKATTTGFGAVFVDLDHDHVTSLEYFDAHRRRLAKAFVPSKKGGLSFLGVVFNKPVVSYVRMTLGNRKVTDHDDGHGDVVVADDFVYGEPQRS
ncbi:hypothetical protein I4F81_001882 [Pyropia yezoensis]|uniref:Uncharacterized protein n=1 Tax=Pyropia yezoensis TaxID=2788 RepID=A0ACC3BN01_PYRYE|nr:hypothetical protein I4F81_001882 [Neopyropia yezoensis]